MSSRIMSSRISVSALLAVVLVVGTLVAVSPGAGAAPIGSPPGGGHVLAAGQIPTTCTEGEYALGASAYASTLGYYWSETAKRWIAAPWCYPRWGYLSASPSQVVSAGATVTVTAVHDDARVTPWIAVYGGMSWSHPGTLVSGCGSFDLTCTVKMGDAKSPPAEWAWGEFHVSGPGRYFVLPPSYAPRCQPEAPCIDTLTNAWSWVGIKPFDGTPKADFTYTVDGGRVDFKVTSTDPLGLTMFHDWSFGDGTTGVGTIPSHTYARTATVPVTLTTTNSNHLSDSITKNIAVKGQPLSITDIALDPPHPQLSDKTVKLTVQVSNADTRPVTGVVPEVKVEPDNVLSLDPTPAIPTFTLPAHGKRSFDLALTPGEAGEAFVKVGAVGVTPEGPTIAPGQSLAVDVGGKDMTVAIDAPERVALVPGDDGAPAPKDVDIKVKVTNTSEGTLHDVTLRKGDPAQIPDDGVAFLPFEEKLPDAVVRLVPSLEPGEEHTFTIPYTALRGGGVEWLVRVDATAGTAPDERDILETATAHSKVTDKGVIVVKLRPQKTPVRAGDVWTLFGSVKNVSNDSDVQLNWLKPKLFGNAAGGWAVDPADPPVIGATRPDVLKPHDTWSFKADIHTAIDMNAISAVEFEVTGKVKRDDVETDLAKDDVAYDGPTRVQASVITPTFDPSEEISFDTIVGNFSYATLTTLWEGLVGLKELPSLIKDVSLNAMAIYGTTERIDFLLTQYETLPKEARDEWIDDAYSSLEQQYGKGNAVLDGLKGQMVTWFSDLRFAVDSGDLNILAGMGGALTANVFDSELLGAFTKLIQPKWGKWLITKTEKFEEALRAESIEDASVALARMEAAPTPTALELAADDVRAKLVSGTPINEAAAKMWGVAPSTHEFLARLAKQRGYLITLRSRGIGALEKLREGFIPKMELIKLKNVNPIDVDYLGYPAEDLNTVVLKQPPVDTVEEVGAWIESHVADPEARGGAAARLKDRVKEWDKTIAGKPGYDYFKYADQKFMPVPFNIAENLHLPFNKAWNKRAVEFIKGVQDKFAGKASFALESVPGHPGYMRLKVNGRGITGDIDFMDFRKANGEQLTLSERVQLYYDLADGTGAGIVQLQHPETISWFMEGSQWFAAKKSYIEEFSGPLSDTLLQYSPEAGGSARAVRYDAKRSLVELDSSGGGGANIWRYEGGFTEVQRFKIGVSDLVFIGGIADTLSALIDYLWDPPTDWLVDPDGGTSAPKAVAAAARTASAFAGETDTRVPVKFTLSTGRSAVIARSGWDRLQSWTPDGGWKDLPYSPSAVLDLMPQTSLDAASRAGATRVPIVAPSVTTVGTATPPAWFEPGQQVVVNPGAKTEEIRTLLAVGPLTLDHPLIYAHSSGEVVAVMAAKATVVANGPSTTTTTLGTAGGPTGNLPFTGGSSTPLYVGIVFVLGGGGLIGGSRRRRARLRRAG